MHLSPGQVLGRFEILGILGAGGMGEVYRARDKQLGREVALKVLPPQFLADPTRLARFEREARVLAALDHGGIARIHGLERLEEMTFLVLEFVPGQTLGQLIDGRSLELGEALPILLRLAEGLELAHECGVIHRDLKPSNVRVTPAGEAKILDFGLAKPTLTASSDTDLHGLAGDVEVTRDGDIIGTPAYMSPEQARGRPVDRRTDVWAFGCVAFECLTGKRAFAGDSVFDVLVAVVDDDPDWNALPESLPPTLRRLLERCLVKDPHRRLRDIGEARLVLENLVQGVAEPSGDAPQPQPRGERRRIPLAAALVTGAIAGASGLWALRPRAAPPVVRKYEILPEGARWGASLQPAISPDGARLAYVSDERLWVRDLAQLEALALPGTEQASHPFWSTDGEWIGFAVVKKLMKVRPQGGTPVEVATLPEEVLAKGGFVWGADDSIVCATAESGLLRVRASGGEVVELLAVDAQTEKDFHEPALLPGKNGLVFPVHYSKRLHHSLDALRDGKRVSLLAVDLQYPERPAYSPSGHLLYQPSRSGLGIWAVPFSAEALAVVGEPFLVTPEGSHPRIAHDGTLVFEHTGRSPRRQLAWLDREGRRLEQALEEELEGLLWPILSPDGRRVALMDLLNSHVWVGELERKTCTRITSRSDRLGPYAWSANSRRIVCASNVGNGYRVVQVEAGGMDEVQVLVDERNVRTSASTEPLLFGAWNEGAGYDIWSLPAGDGPPSALIATDGRDENPAVSHDGKLLAWVSTKNNRSEVYVTTYPEPGPQLQVSVTGGRDPRWSKESLFFVTRDNELMEVRVETDPELRLGEVRRLFSGYAVGVDFVEERYDVSPDGQRILVLQDPSRGMRTPRLVVVENWFAEFKRR